MVLLCGQISFDEYATYFHLGDRPIKSGEYVTQNVQDAPEFDQIGARQRKRASSVSTSESIERLKSLDKTYSTKDVLKALDKAGGDQESAAKLLSANQTRACCLLS